MKKLLTPFSVGLVLLAGIAGFLYSLDMIKGRTFTNDETYAVTAILEDAGSLALDSTVTMAGIAVGRIDSIELVQTDDNVRAVVTMRIDRKVLLHKGLTDPEGRLRGGAVVMRKQASMLSDYFLALAPGSLGDPLVDGDRVPNVIEKTGLDMVFDQASKIEDIYPKLDRIATNLEELTKGLAIAMGGDKGGENIGTIIANIRTISEDMVKISSSLKDISFKVEDLVESGEIDVIAADLAETSRSASVIAARVEKMINAGQMDELVKNLADTSEALSVVGQDLQVLVRDGVKPKINQLGRVFENLEKFSANISSISSVGGKSLLSTLDNFQLLSEEALNVVGRSKGDVESTLGTLKGTLAAAQGSILKLSDVLDDVSTLTGDLRRGRGTVGRLLTDDKLIDQIEQVVDDTSNFVKQYTLMQTHVEMTSYYLWRDGSKNVFELRFQPKEDKYYLFQLVDDPRGNTTITRLMKTTTNPTEAAQVEETLSKTTETLKFTFQFAKRWHFLTGRFGIMENTGGLGLDMAFFQDRLQFQFDLFDFALNNNPRLRSEVEFEIFRHFFISAGADDVLNDNMRDYYLGAGIRFTDEDLRSLIMAAPSISP